MNWNRPRNCWPDIGMGEKSLGPKDDLVHVVRGSLPGRTVKKFDTKRANL